jgi:SpoVK/Ycf46/Vps4 family AAA+-type ATPase
MTVLCRFSKYSIHPLTGADMAAICKDAALRALREDIDAKEIPMRFFIQAWDQRVVGSMKQ